MLAAVSTAPDPQEPRAPGPRDRADACPGALRLHAADDGGLARVRVPGGVLTADQAAALGAAAARLGDGALHLTSRGNVQLRGLDPDCGAELGQLLTSAGLLPAPGHERVRNVVASPLSGLDGRGHLDVRSWLRELDELLCADPATRALSGRFLFALDDGRGDVAALGADVTVRAVPGGAALLRLGREAPLRVPAPAAASAALLAAVRFLAAAGGGTAWRVADLPDGGAALTGEVAGELGRLGLLVAEAEGGRGSVLAGAGAHPPGRAPAAPVPVPAPGIVTHPATGTAALSVLVPLGRLDSPAWRALTELTARTPDAELRLTPWRGAVVPGVPAARALAELDALAAAGLVTDARSPWLGVSACTGRPGCAKSLADVRTDAAAAHVGPPSTGHAGGPEHVSADTRAEAAATHVASPGGDGTGQLAHSVRTDAPSAHANPSMGDVGKPDHLPAGARANTPTAHAGPGDGASARPARSTADAGPAADRNGAGQPAPLPVHWAGCGRCCGRPRGDRVEVVATSEGYRVDVARAGTVHGGAVPEPTDLAATVAAARRGAVSR